MANEKDDLLNPDEIEALLSKSGQTPPGAGQPKTPGASSGSPKGKLPRDPSELLNEAEKNLYAAMASELETGNAGGSSTGEPYRFPDLDEANAGGNAGVRIGALHDVELDLRIELGRTELLIDEVLKLTEGSVVPLDKLAGDPVDILINGRLVARGEVLVLNDNFCVRVAEILAPDF